MKVWRNLLLSTLILIFTEAVAHPYHTSIADVHYNTKKQTFEIALKVFTDDLEKTLSNSAKKLVVINQTPAVQTQLTAYLKRTFALEISAKKVLPAKFIGSETEGDTQWLYLEIPAKPEELKQLKLRNQVLMETFEDQRNLVNLEIKGQKQTLLFSSNDFLKPISN